MKVIDRKCSPTPGKAGSINWKAINGGSSHTFSLSLHNLSSMCAFYPLYIGSSLSTLVLTGVSVFIRPAAATY